MCPHKQRCRPPGPKSIVVKRLGRSASLAIVRGAGSPRDSRASVMTPATARSSPGRLGLGAAISASASCRIPSRSMPAAVPKRGSIFLVAACPIDALPRPQAHRCDVEQPALLVERRLEVLGAVLAQVAERHPLRDLDPTSPEVGPLHELGLTLDDDLAKCAALVDGDGAARIGLEVSGPRRLHPRDHPESVPVPLMPHGDHVGPASLIQAGEPGDVTCGEKAVQLLLVDPPNL